MINQSLFDKYKSLTFTSQEKSIDPLIAIRDKKCPYCFCKLYEMQNKPFWYCRSKKHRKMFKTRFIISKEKMTPTP